jgi:hypothetical protein
MFPSRPVEAFAFDLGVTSPSHQGPVIRFIYHAARSVENVSGRGAFFILTSRSGHFTTARPVVLEPLP